MCKLLLSRSSSFIPNLVFEYIFMLEYRLQFEKERKIEFFSINYSHLVVWIYVDVYVENVAIVTYNHQLLFQNYRVSLELIQAWNQSDWAYGYIFQG